MLIELISTATDEVTAFAYVVEGKIIAYKWLDHYDIITDTKMVAELNLMPLVRAQVDAVIQLNSITGRA